MFDVSPSHSLDPIRPRMAPFPTPVQRLLQALPLALILLMDDKPIVDNGDPNLRAGVYSHSIQWIFFDPRAWHHQLRAKNIHALSVVIVSGRSEDFDVNQ